MTALVYIIIDPIYILKTLRAFESFPQSLF